MRREAFPAESNENCEIANCNLIALVRLHKHSTTPPLLSNVWSYPNISSLETKTQYNTLHVNLILPFNHFASFSISEDRVLMLQSRKLFL